MERQRKTKFIIMITLMLVVAGMSLGFAAFSATLSISSSASVTPNEEGFVVHMHNEPNHVSGLEPVKIVAYNGAELGVQKFLAKGEWIIPIDGYFSEPGQYIEASFYAVNEGYYDAYLTGITFHNVDGTNSFSSCTLTSDSEATQSLVDAACDDFSVIVDVGGTILDEQNTTLSGHKLSKGSAELVKIKLLYNNDGDRADGDFFVKFGDISLNFSTVDNEKPELISFYIGEEEFYAISGWTWSDFAKSEYNTISLDALSQTLFVSSDNKVFVYGYYLKASNTSALQYGDDIIVSGASYYSY